jgi:positive regulator of sigma E activity
MCARDGQPPSGGSIRTRVHTDLDLSPGECVLVDARIPSDALIAGLLFGLPLVCMLIVVFLCVFFLPQRESLAVAGSVAGLALGYALGVMLHSLVPAFKVRIDSITRPHASPASAHTITDSPRTVKE